MSLRAIIIDDDPVSILMIENFCKKCGGILIENTYTDPIKGAAGIVIKKPDLVFLDVEMPEFTGPQIIRALSVPPKFVVMSSNKNFKPLAQVLNATAFLQKPVGFETFNIVVNKIAKELKVA
ncbi:MAG: response regulator [Cyclobacteriaceae bacterium]